MNHKCKEIVIKKAEVDELLIPIIEWLNGYEDIHTRWCCECDDPTKPIIIFYCEDPLTLCTVLKKVHALAEVQVEFWEPAGSLRYKMIIANKEMVTVLGDIVQGCWKPEANDKISMVNSGGFEYPTPVDK